MLGSFMHGSPSVRQPPSVSDNSDQGGMMGLFRKRAKGDDAAERCPRCRERLPDGATACMMCGVALEPLLGELRNEEEKVSSAPRRDG
jgi:hypothetical protein